MSSKKSAKRPSPEPDSDSDDSVSKAKRFECTKCKQTFSSTSNLKRHFNKKHVTVKPPLKTYKFPCLHCKRKYNRAQDFKRHVKVEHASELETSATLGEYTCESCGCLFNKLVNLRVHKEKFHSDPKAATPVNFKGVRCPLCKNSFEKESILEHFGQDHAIQIQSFEWSVPSLLEFERWKEGMEKDEKCNFKKVRAVVSVGKKYTYFQCHRSGLYVSKGTGKRHLKKQGSVKMGAYCPASIAVCESGEGGGCEVKMVATHVGHDRDLRHLRLPAAHRRALARDIAHGRAFDDILGDIRAEHTPDRLHLLTKKDLYNMAERLSDRKRKLAARFQRIVDELETRKEFEVVEKDLDALEAVLRERRR